MPGIKSENVYLILIFTITLPVLIVGYFTWVYQVGFPDGYMTEYARSMLLVFGFCQYGLMAGALLSLYLRFLSSGKNITGWLRWILGFALLILLVLGSAHFYADHFLDSGRGG